MWAYPKDRRQAATAVSFGLITYLMTEYMSTPEAPVVTISTGKLKGIVAKSREGWEYFEYLGIPYAKAPVGSLRFEPPHYPENWTGIRNANRQPSECMQFELMVTARTVGSEDCLYLNVFTPIVETVAMIDKPLPVMVYFHGGYFMAGSSKMYQAKYFMDEDIVLVTVNYRLAALGFLNTGDDVVRGNMGLKDQNMALRWVQANIRKFGGDPNQVTIFGESAGAASVHYHILSHQSRGLFHKAISQSGSALKAWAMTKDPGSQARKLGSMFHCPTRTSEELVSCLKHVDPQRLVQVHQAAMSVVRHPHDSYLPTIESVKRPDTFISDYPLNLIARGSFNKVPWMSGVNSAEGLLNLARLLSNKSLSDRLDKEWIKWAPIMLGYDPSAKNVSEKIRNFYFGPVRRVHPVTHVNNFTNLFSDRMFFHGTHKSAVYHARYAPVYLYYNTYAGEVSLFNLMKAVSPVSRFAAELQVAFDMAKDLFYSMTYGKWFENLGPCHADELPLLFNMHMLAGIKKSSRDYLMSRAMVKAWTDFAKNEKPLSFMDVPWPPISANSSVFYMNLDRYPSLIPEPFTQRLRFWDYLGV
ncbi:unnamed protein product [Allacma fusca]|uniref:Carboxylic ester hydrolase n=1 Tax=Allacma fusca TaxID=39272 RepID=A0A8J2PI95_9HEXA|nr:unnamed protein product [Allacma fusca]